MYVQVMELWQTVCACILRVIKWVIAAVMVMDMASCSSGGSVPPPPRLNVEPSEDPEYYDSASNQLSSNGSSSSTWYQSAHNPAHIDTESQFYSPVEAEIAASRIHWTGVDEDSDEELPKYSHSKELDTFESFKRDFALLPRHEDYFFDERHFVVGDRIAQGMQGTIYAATSSLPQHKGTSLVLKVFHKNLPLLILQRSWPRGMINFWSGKTHTTAKWANAMDSVRGAVIFKTGMLANQFAFVMERKWGDLRTHIDQRSLIKRRPYSDREALSLMYHISRDMARLHDHGILHRDLKASNVLLQTHSTLESVHYDRVADFECSVGIVCGTGFWRAPEILRQQKDGVPVSRLKFTPKADVYSFGMTCYEIVTGRDPFEGEIPSNYDIVLSGKQLELPLDLLPFVRKLIRRCWCLDPLERPDFREIERMPFRPV